MARWMTRRRTVWLVLSTLALLVPSAPAHAATHVVRLTTDPAKESETSMAISTVHPNVMVVGWNEGRRINGHALNMGYAYTTDGGPTAGDWTSNLYLKGITQSDPTGLEWTRDSDPVVVYSAKDDTFKFATIGIHGSRSSAFVQTAVVYVSSSTTADAPTSGLTWKTPVTLQKSVDTQLNPGAPFCSGTWTDKPDMTVDNDPASSHYGRIYVAWHERNCGDTDVQVWVTHHDDGVRGWSTPVRDSTNAAYPVNWGPSIRVGGDGGTVYVAWCAPLTVQLCRGQAPAAVLISSSTDGGDTWTPPAVAAAFVIVPAHVPGQTVNENAHPVITVNPTDASLVHVVYPAWNGSDTDVEYVHSTDGGATWSAPVRLGAGAPDQFLPWLSNSPDGHELWACYYTDGYHPPLIDVACAESTDGSTFGKPVRATTASLDPGKAKGLGDYIASAVGPDGEYRAAWAGFQSCCPGANEDIYVGRG
jgi:hypothetical protein